jgi:transposase
MPPKSAAGLVGGRITIGATRNSFGIMVDEEFPRLHRPAAQSREVLRMLRYRQKLIKLRTMTKNSLQAIALQAGLAKGKQLFTAGGQEQFQAAAMSPVLQWQREHWFELLKPFNQQLLETMVWFKAQSKDDVNIQRLRTHPGIGLLTSLCLLHTLQPVSRFRNARKVTAYAGFDPVERSSAERNTFWGSAKAARGCCATCWWKQCTPQSDMTRT